MIGFHFTDLHIRDSRPSCRLDADYLETQLSELSYVFAQASSAGIKNILCSGDLGHQYNWTDRAIIKFTELCMDYEVKVITCLGQHDVKRHNIAGYHTETSIRVLENTGVVIVLRAGQHWKFENQVVYGFGYNELETLDMLAGKSAPIKKDSGLHYIALVHASVGSTGTVGIQDTIDNQNIKDFDLALFGDIHVGFPIHKFPSGTLAISPGAMARHYYTDVDRVPTYLRYAYENEKYVLNCEGIPHADKYEVFDIVKKQYEKAAATKWNESAKNAASIVSIDPTELVRSAAKVNNIRDEVIELVLTNMG